jgi:glutamyl/glutaminyl-tRNA synthetase
LPADNPPGNRMSHSNVVTRFAPSPTGYLHMGGARTALFCWLLARSTGGRYLLRIEDTDLARSTPSATAALMEDLRWLGLQWDNPDPIHQSRRVPIYHAICDDLIRRGMAYKAWETTEELDAQRRAAERARRAYLYRRPQLTDEQMRKFEAEGRPFVVRFVMPVEEYRFDDAVLGPGQGVGPDQVQDFVILKSDRMPTYHFAVVVDDAEMQITHVLRGQEHLLNTVQHIALQKALGYPRPIYAHLPVILNIDGTKMSKRDRDKKVRLQAQNWLRSTGKPAAEVAAAAKLDPARFNEWLADSGKQLDASEQEALMPLIGLRAGDLPEVLIHEFRANGYLPHTLNNFLALLGWSPGGDRERMTMDEMVKLFSLEHVGKSNARFNREKLLAFNTEACAAASPRDLLAAMHDYLSVNPSSPLATASDEMLSDILRISAGFHTLREADEKSRFLCLPDDAINYDAAAVQKFLLKDSGQGLGVLRDMQTVLAAASPWAAATIEQPVKEYCQAKSLGLGKVAQPIRVAVSGTSISPPIFETLEVLRQPATMRRIARCISHAGN